MKKETDIADRKEQAEADLDTAKRLSSKSIRELKLAGVEIKESEVMSKQGEKKRGSKMQRRSESLTERAVHTMLKSRRLSHKAQQDLTEARSVAAQLPSLEVKAKQVGVMFGV